MLDMMDISNDDYYWAVKTTGTVTQYGPYECNCAPGGNGMQKVTGYYL
jgi:hypothetical protein